MFLEGKVDEALRQALSLENQPTRFSDITRQLRTFADETFRFTMPIFPQPVALADFVQKSIVAFPEYFSRCHEDIPLLHHLQRYAACYLAHKTGYFERRRLSNPTPQKPEALKIKLPARSNVVKSPSSLGGKRPSPEPSPTSSHAPTAINEFLAGCHPPMLHLLELFLHARITGEIHLEGMARWPEERLRDYLISNLLTRTPFEVETLTQAFARKGARVPSGRAATSIDAEEEPDPGSIRMFLERCHPPMAHLFEAFFRGGITNEASLQELSRWNEESLRRHFRTELGINPTPLELEAVIQAFAEKKI
ncbi:hypothetical protein C8R43DRAFT_143000 [Mycena crocata]|nr:hypothetical protein C8R43DRAFT_143000 [Mycena crocata]